jgi:hypothetical protein
LARAAAAGLHILVTSHITVDMVYQKTKYTLKIRNRSLHIPDMSRGKRRVPGLWPLCQTSEIKKKQKTMHSFVHSRRLALLVAKILIIM